MRSMRGYKSIRNRRGRKKLESGLDLQLTSLMDILIIILVFLLKSHTVATTTFPADLSVALPMSSTDTNPYDALNLVVAVDRIAFEDVPVVEFAEAAQNRDADQDAKGLSTTISSDFLDEGGMRIIPLFDALVRARQKAELLRAKSKAR